MSTPKPTIRVGTLADLTLVPSDGRFTSSAVSERAVRGIKQKEVNRYEDQVPAALGGRHRRSRQPVERRRVRLLGRCLLGRLVRLLGQRFLGRLRRGRVVLSAVGASPSRRGAALRQKTRRLGQGR